MPGVWIFTHLVQPEPFLACFISLAFWCLAEARAEAPETAGRWYFRFSIFLALGTMSKGLHGALWPLGTVLLAAIFYPSWRPWLSRIFPWRGLAAFALIVVPWYAWMTVKFPGFLSAHFINEQIGAGLNTRYPPDAHQLPAWQFYAQHLIFWLPWTLLVPVATLAARRKVEGITSDLIALLAIFFVLVMLSVALSTREDYYSMACWGVAAAFFAWPWMMERPSRGWLIVVPVALALAGLGALGLAGWMTANPLGQGAAAPIAARDTFMDAIAGISPALWGRMLVLLWIFGAALLPVGVVAAILVWRRKFFPALVLVAGSAAVPICLAATGFTIMSPYFSLAKSARAINRELRPDSLVACEARPNTASSLLYYLNVRVHWVNAPFDNDYAQRVLGEGRDYYWDEPALLRAWQAAAPVYFIVEEERLDYWRSRLGGRVLLHDSTRVVLCNR
jgi:4-amino-4-deoxy-L-arabinose transferase-like glycosyltransferase